MIFRQSRFNPGQWKLLKADGPYTLMAGGVGSGKTTALCAKILQLRYQNWGHPGLLVAPSAPMLKGVTLRELQRIYRLSFPDMPRPRICDWMGERYLEFFDGGEKLYLRTATKPEGIEGFSVAYAAGDEARWWPYLAYQNLIARVLFCPKYPYQIIPQA